MKQSGKAYCAAGAPARAGVTACVGARAPAVEAGAGTFAAEAGAGAACAGFFTGTPAEERGQAKLSARPAGAASASPRTRTLAAVGSGEPGDGREAAPNRSPPSPVP